MPAVLAIGWLGWLGFSQHLEQGPGFRTLGTEMETGQPDPKGGAPSADRLVRQGRLEKQPPVSGGCGRFSDNAVELEQ